MTGLGRSPGLLGVVAAVGLLCVSSVRYSRASLPQDGPQSVSAVASSAAWIDSLVEASDVRSVQHPDPFAWAGPMITAAEGTLEDALEFAPPLFLYEEPPQILGVGRRPNGMSFAGCAASGRSPRIVRVGDMCGAYQLHSVVGDSVRLLDPVSDSLVTRGIGSR